MKTNKIPRQIGTEHTVDFVKGNAAPGATVLDVGCGDGAIAKALMDAGYVVEAIDASEGAVDKARALGVSATHGDLLTFGGRTFDAILLSRSLHHLHPIEAAVAKLRTLLSPQGTIILEEFGPELLDLKSAIWLYGLKSVVQSGQHEHDRKGRGAHLDNGGIPLDPLTHWHEDFRKHEVTESGVLMAALRAEFDVQNEQRIPYLYRYLLDDLNYEQGCKVWQWEVRLCEQNLVTPIGVRAVAKHRQR